MEPHVHAQGAAPGVASRTSQGARSYLVGLLFAVGLTVASFWASKTTFVYPPAVPVLLAALAIAQMGVHVAFFLHISSAPDQTNNFLALAFGVFVTALVVFGSMIIMSQLSHTMMSMEELMRIQR